MQSTSASCQAFDGAQGSTAGSCPSTLFIQHTHPSIPRGVHSTPPHPPNLPTSRCRGSDSDATCAPNSGVDIDAFGTTVGYKPNTWYWVGGRGGGGGWEGGVGGGGWGGGGCHRGCLPMKSTCASCQAFDGDPQHPQHRGQPSTLFIQHTHPSIPLHPNRLLPAAVCGGPIQYISIIGHLNQADSHRG